LPSAGPSRSDRSSGDAGRGEAGLLRREWGFSRSVRQAPIFYGLVAIGILGGTALSLLAVNPIKLLILVAVINGMAAAPFLVVVMLIAGSRRLMGDYVNGKLAKAVGWATASLMAIAAIALIASGGISL
jgi:Mn2+/Fe2+ NRAMP family transporter